VTSWVGFADFVLEDGNREDAKDIDETKYLHDTPQDYFCNILDCWRDMSYFKFFLP